jgi:hypothetical protein
MGIDIILIVYFVLFDFMQQNISISSSFFLYVFERGRKEVEMKIEACRFFESEVATLFL